MSVAELKIWIRAQLETIDPRAGEASAEYADVVRELKIRTLEFNPTLSLSLPIRDKKYAASAVGQLRRVLEEIETPPPAIEGGDMSVQQVASLLGVSKETVYGLCASGDLECNRHGRRITISPQQLEEYRRLSVR